MNRAIVSVSTVSDGLMVAFGDGHQGYFSAEFLLEHLGSGSNQIFLDYDPTPKENQPSFPTLTLVKQ